MVQTGGEFPGPTAKRPRVATGRENVPVFERRVASSVDLLQTCMVKKRTVFKDGSMEYSVYWAESKTNPGLTTHYISNPSNHTAKIRKGTCLGSSGEGKFHDKMVEAGKAELRPGVIVFPWDLSRNSLFTYKFSSEEVAITDFDTMIVAARQAASLARVELYAHNLSDAPCPNSVNAIRRVVPRAKKTVEVVLQLQELPESDWRLEALANFLVDEACELAAAAVLVPAFRVRLAEGWVVPVHDVSPLDLVVHKDGKPPWEWGTWGWARNHATSMQQT